MAKITFSVNAPVSPERLLKAATDFSERRPEIWPAIDPKVYRVHALSASSAEVTEGSAVMGGIWARERYDWSVPGTVCATVQDSNVFKPGGTWLLRVQPGAAGGCQIEVSSHRQAKGFKGHMLGAMLQLMGAKALPQSFDRTIEILKA